MSGTQSVGKKTAHAAAWGLASTAAARVIAFVSFAVLARILAPHEFGLLAFALSYIAYAETIGDLGSGSALVYWPDRREEAAQITFLVNAAAGIFWCITSIALAPWVADFFHAANGAPLVRALAFSFPIKFLGTAHDALAQKDLRFRARAVPELGFAAIKAVVAVTLALFGFGAWSLVWGQLAGLTAQTIFAWMIVPWRPSFTFPHELFRPMLAYGRSIMWSNILHAIASDADIVFVGHYLGVTALGLYQVAARVVETGISVVLRVITRVLFPAFAQLQGTAERLHRAYLLATHIVPAITLPAAVGISVLAHPIIFAAFGAKWAAAVPILALLSMHIGLQTLAAPATDLLSGTGRPNLVVALSVGRASIVVIALFFAAPYGTVAIAGTLVVTSGTMAIVSVVTASRAIGVSLFETARAYLPAFVSSALMAAVVLFCNRLTADFGPWTQLVCGVAAGVLTYAAAIWLTDREIVEWAKRTLLRRKSVEPANVPV